SMTKVTGLPNQMFYKCSSLKNVTLPETCTSVGSYAFANCPKLESVYIPASVTEISDKAFKNSSAVTIKGIAGSYAEEYAKANNIPFNGISAYDVGDVNMDGGIDILDATLIQKYVAGIVELSAEQKYLADYINDGDITVVDATKIQKFIVHLN
ncbi:MAG: leucine-rich repeat protein, partial [Ruminococcus bromii]